MAFDPNAAAAPGSGIFGLPYTEADAALVLLPVPWDATTSYGKGASSGPSAILRASHQVDLYDFDVHKPYEAGICMLPESVLVCAWNEAAKIEASRVIEVGGVVAGNPELEQALARVNKFGEELNQFVLHESRRVLAAGKILGVVGGDHSVPLGAIQAIAERYPSFDILHFDAHFDLRKAFEGFTYSHASIMWNVLQRVPNAGRVTQVGIRDVCEEEVGYWTSFPFHNRLRTFLDGSIQRRKFSGEPFASIAEEIPRSMAPNVWVSFDIDGLDPRFCPHTGTPVPGGLTFDEANYILAKLVESKRTIIGFDLSEVSPAPDEEDEWDANVGARLLYKLCAWTLASQGKCKVSGW